MCTLAFYGRTRLNGAYTGRLIGACYPRKARYECRSCQFEYRLKFTPTVNCSLTRRKRQLDCSLSKLARRCLISWWGFASREEWADPSEWNVPPATPLIGRDERSRLENTMRKLLILAGAASILAFPVAAAAKDHGQGHHGHGNGQIERGTNHSDRYARHEHDRGVGYRHTCPPGLAKKPGCLPPGQAWRIGQRSPWSNERYVDYGSLPSYYRDRYPDVTGQRYYYEGNRVYTIDPVTQLIRNIFNIRR